MKTRILLSLLLTMLITSTTSHTMAQGKKILVAYFSHSGNTATVARQIAQATGGDLFEIQMTNPYTESYQELTKRAKQEIADGVRPTLKTKVADITSYDVIFIGSPCWWGTIAPPVASFLAGYDLAGKTVVPFMTHGGSGMGRSESEVKKLCPKSTVLEGLPVTGRNAANAQGEVNAWLRKLKITE